MPLLPKEADLFPDELFSLAEPWLVAHVRSRQEKVLARHLVEQGIGFYLPLAESKRRRAGRTFTSYSPLFNGYVFLRAGRERRTDILRSGVIASLIDVPDQQQFGEELLQIRQLQLSGASLTPYDQLVPGDPVKIDSGAFRGYTGVVVREKANERLIVRISLLHQAVAVELDRDVLKRAR